ncbi:hypothetical protein [Hymenobacter radiodurans]|uniref:hypothetical protein n=1 Tax=Hymenobacter radiodurans TaxID=2496028 RepID=UPI001058AE36|nr:hypothetical protein [Hymenobacter radiodurans]
MTSFYKNTGKFGQVSAFLICLFFFGAQQSWGQVVAPVPHKLAQGAYSEVFTNIAGWQTDFASGIGAAPYSKATPSPTLPNTNTVFATGSGGGVQKGVVGSPTEGKIVLLATGTPSGSNASAFDLNIDFTNSSSGTISFDWAQISNSTGNRQSTFKVQTNTGDGGLLLISQLQQRL